MDIEKTCQRCGNTIILKPDPACPTDWAQKLSLLVKLCQRCADFGWSRLRIQESVDKAAVNLAIHKDKTTKTKRDEQEINSSTDSIRKLCRKYAVKVCDFYKRRFLYDEAVADCIIAEPQKGQTLLNIYEAGIRKSAEMALPEARPVTNDP